MRFVCCVWAAEGVRPSAGAQGKKVSEQKEKAEPPDETGKRYPEGARVGDHSDNPLRFFSFCSFLFFMRARV